MAVDEIATVKKKKKNWGYFKSSFRYGFFKFSKSQAPKCGPCFNLPGSEIISICSMYLLKICNKYALPPKYIELMSGLDFFLTSFSLQKYRNVCFVYLMVFGMYNKYSKL